jgi:hypothetical protein
MEKLIEFNNRVLSFNFRLTFKIDTAHDSVELEIHTSKSMIIVAFYNNGIYGVSEITPSNIDDRIFTYYDDIQFEDFELAFDYTKKLIESYGLPPITGN